MRTLYMIGLLFLIGAATAAAGGSAEVTPQAGENGFTRVAAQDVELEWKVDGEKIVFVMSAPTTGWVAVGFDPDRAMKGADMIFGFVEGGEAEISDHYGDGLFSHKADTALGGSKDVRLIEGSEENGRTTLRFSVPIDSGDQFDRSLTPGEIHTVLFAYGPDGEDNFSAKHAFRSSAEFEL